MPEKFYDWAEHAPDLAEVAPAAVSGAVVLREQRPPVVIPSGVDVHYAPDGMPVYVRRPVEQVERRRDPWPARLLCGGVGLGAAGWGLGFLFQAIAQATVAIGLLAACLALVWLLKSSGGNRGGGASVSVRGDNNRVSIQ